MLTVSYTVHSAKESEAKYKLQIKFQFVHDGIVLKYRLAIAPLAKQHFLSFILSDSETGHCNCITRMKFLTFSTK